jgi:RNA polymerase sigma-70 factor (ECF subfamily)
MEAGRDGRLQDRQWSQWMAAAQAGDSRSYERLLRDILPFLRVLARRRLREADQVEDVVQEALLTLHRVRHTYDASRPFTPWLAAICDRRAIDALRKHIRQTTHEKADERAYETFADPSANKELEAQDAAQAMAAMIATLPPGQREALELVKVMQMSLAEASAVSGQSVGALKVSVHRAIKALRLRARAPE